MSAQDYFSVCYLMNYCNEANFSRASTLQLDHGENIINLIILLCFIVVLFHFIMFVQCKVFSRPCSKQVIPKECAICLNLLEDDVIVLYCRHAFHEACVTKWFEHSNGSKCPLCMQEHGYTLCHMVLCPRTILV